MCVEFARVKEIFLPKFSYESWINVLKRIKDKKRVREGGGREVEVEGRRNRGEKEIVSEHLLI